MRQSGQVILASAIADDDRIAERDWGRLGRRLVDRALAGDQGKPLVEVQLRLSRPLVAIGAPVAHTIRRSPSACIPGSSSHPMPM